MGMGGSGEKVVKFLLPVAKLIYLPKDMKYKNEVIAADMMNECALTFEFKNLSRP
jgi:hypothetical protein